MKSDLSKENPKSKQIKAEIKESLAATGFFRRNTEFVEEFFGWINYEKHKNFITQFSEMLKGKNYKSSSTKLLRASSENRRSRL